jgi:hypothetical protein
MTSVYVKDMQETAEDNKVIEYCVSKKVGLGILKD